MVLKHYIPEFKHSQRMKCHSRCEITFTLTYVCTMCLAFIVRHTDTVQCVVHRTSHIVHRIRFYLIQRTNFIFLQFLHLFSILLFFYYFSFFSWFPFALSLLFRAPSILFEKQPHLGLFYWFFSCTKTS